MAHSAILCIDVPPLDGELTLCASKCAQRIQSASREQPEQFADIQHLGGYAWLIPLHTSLPFLNLLAHLADTGGFSYRVLYLDKEPNWLEFYPEGAS